MEKSLGDEGEKAFEFRKKGTIMGVSESEFFFLSFFLLF